MGCIIGIKLPIVRSGDWRGILSPSPRFIHLNFFGGLSPRWAVANFYGLLATKILAQDLEPYAVWVTKERSEEVGASELAGARRLLEAVRSMASFVERARDTERQMRSDRGGLEQGLAEAERFGELERLLAHVDSAG